MAIQKIICKTNEEWRRERAKSVGASAVGTILGVNRFETAAQLAEKMRAELAGRFDYTQTTAMRRGHYYEGGVAQYFENETGHEIIDASAVEYIVRRDDIPFLHASPDRIYWLSIPEEGPRHGKEAEKNKGVLECKTTRRSVSLEKLPLSWVLQLNMQMGLTGYHEGALAWDVLSKAEGFGYCEFFFNEKIFKATVEVCRDFWRRCIINGKPPLSQSEIKRKFPAINDCGIKLEPTYNVYQHRENHGYEYWPRELIVFNPSSNRCVHRKVGMDTLSWFGGLLNKLKKDS